MLSKFKNVINSKWFYAAMVVLSLEVLFRAVCVFGWNWLFSSGINLFLFGTEKLPMLKGIIIFTLVQLIVKPEIYANWVIGSIALLRSNHQIMGDSNVNNN